MDSSMFDPQVAALAPEYRVIAWDERGFGGTRATGSFSYWDSARDALALLDHLGIERAVLAGMSQGGFLSLRAALLAPDRVRALVLIDSQAGLENPEAAPAYGPIDYAPWFTKWAALDRAETEFAFRCLMDRDDITGRLGEISCPTLILHGTADAAIPMAKAEVVRDGLAGTATLVQIEGGSHAANLSHPDEVNTAIHAFLRSSHRPSVRALTAEHA
jgi:pimeloyl-ACP methyl ester carboxylesterase